MIAVLCFSMPTREPADTFYELEMKRACHTIHRGGRILSLQSSLNALIEINMEDLMVIGEILEVYRGHCAEIGVSKVEWSLEIFQSATH